MNDAVHSAVERGHRELAGKLVAEGFKQGGYGFNVLHQNVSPFYGSMALKFCIRM